MAFTSWTLELIWGFIGIFRGILNTMSIHFGIGAFRRQPFPAYFATFSFGLLTVSRCLPWYFSGRVHSPIMTLQFHFKSAILSMTSLTFVRFQISYIRKDKPNMFPFIECCMTLWQWTLFPVIAIVSMLYVVTLRRHWSCVFLFRLIAIAVFARIYLSRHILRQFSAD